MRLLSKLRFCGLIAWLMFILILAYWQSAHDNSADDKLEQTWAGQGSSRHLLSLVNCTPRAISQFPTDLFSQEQRKNGAIIVHVLTAVYMFVGFALLCDDYFVPSLEVLCDVLKMKPDVAGATFMAAGSSAPELATAVIAVFIAKDDIGLGTVVGSAVYNVMFVISFCALFAGMVVHLSWWPLSRDCIFYSLSVCALAVVIIDERVFWYEAVGFIVLYMIYILLMYFNSSLEAWITPKFSCCFNNVNRRFEDSESTVLFSKSSQNGTTKQHGATPTSNGVEPSNDTTNNRLGETYNTEDADFDESEEDEVTTELLLSERKTASLPDESNDEPVSVLAPPSKCWKICLWCSTLPLKLLFYISIPDCRFPRWRRWFPVTFVMCLVWLSGLSYLMVWMITVIGYTAGIADSVMALTFVAFGVSLPDVIASLIVVRDGYGDMAVSNAVGSNVFDILVCLGIPWLIQTIRSQGRPVQVYSEGLLWATVTLLGTVIFLLIATHVNGWRLTKKYGFILLIVYVLFTVVTSLYELNIFGYFHPPECNLDL